MIDNCAAGPRQILWQLFHRCWTKSDGPSYDKDEWKELEVEMTKAIEAAVKEEREACAKIADEVEKKHVILMIQGKAGVSSLVARTTAKYILEAIRKRGQ